jgi:hypothetical protein
MIPSKLQEKPSALKKEHSALQNMEFINSFLLFWVIFALLDLDPQFGSGLGSRDPIESDSILVANFISQSGISEQFPSNDFLEEDSVHLKFISLLNHVGKG